MTAILLGSVSVREYVLTRLFLLLNIPSTLTKKGSRYELSRWSYASLISESSVTKTEVAC